MKLRKATLADVKTVQKLSSLLSVKEQMDYDVTIDPAWPLSAAGKKYFTQRIQKGFAVLAVENNEIVGYCFGSLIEPIFYRMPHKTAELETMFIKDAHRSKGIGSAMMKQFLTWCKKNKAAVIRVLASAKNDAGIRFYHKHGFRPIDTYLEINPHNPLLHKK